MAVLILFSIILLQCSNKLAYRCNAQVLPKFSAIFVFGDSGVDTGNNNYLPTIFRADYKPYGINFPGGIPTGRFSDGKLIPDIAASLLGLEETVPPFLNPNLSDDELRKGACFASAASGLDNETNALFGQINLLKQPDYFAAYIDRLKSIVGEQEAGRIVGDALVMINAGNVDFIANYLALGNRLLEYSVTEYQDLLLNNLQTLIKKLYDLGCRKMIVAGLIPLGCMPLIMTVKSPLLRTCIEQVNSDAQIYNEKLATLLPHVQERLPGSVFFYADIYTPLMELINNPQKHGFKETSRGCCGIGLIEVLELCNPSTPVCENPEQHVFWDSIHPTERACRYIVEYIIKQASVRRM